MKTLEDARQALKAVVAEKGKDHTASCQYWSSNGKPICIVGHVLDRWGYAPATVMIGTAKDVLKESEISREAITYLDIAQRIQDDRYGEAERRIRYVMNGHWEGLLTKKGLRTVMWGRALREAEKYAKSVQANDSV